VRTWINTAVTKLGSHQLAWRLASTALDRPVHQLWVTTIADSDRAILDRCLVEYLAGKPLTRIRGYTEFYGYTFHTSPAVLDPRPETEMIVRHGIERNPRSVLDLGTGSGCIVCSILATLANHKIRPQALATDISSDALRIATRNAQRLGVDCEFRPSDWCANITETFDLVVCNPPYISTHAPLPQDVWAYDPPISLYGGPSGTLAHAIALPQLPRILNPGGTVLWEIGYDQRDWILDLAHQTFPHARDIRVFDDFNQLPRMLHVQL